MAQKLSQEEPYRTQLKGESGDLGSDQAVRTALQPRTLWCADGEICKLPSGKKGIDWGYGGSKIWDDGHLRITTDDNLYIRNASNFGYVLEGNQNNFQGASHFRGGDINLHEDRAINLPHGWKIHARQDGLRFFKDGDQKFVVHNEGEPWAKTTGFLVGMRPEYEIKRRDGGCLDHGSHGQGCDLNNGARAFRIRMKDRNDGYYNA
jgi:hypothetical protein